MENQLESLENGGSLTQLAQRIGERLLKAGVLLATAESCTGGGIAEAITRIPGSSAWFDTGFVTYSNEAKQELLGVSEQILATVGAVSELAVKAMVQGALDKSIAGIAVAVSGVAGPGGASDDKPVGTVWLAWGYGDICATRMFHFHGDRQAVRTQAVIAALEGIEAMLLTTGS